MPDLLTARGGTHREQETRSSAGAASSPLPGALQLPAWDRALLDAIPDAVAVLDENGVIRAVNRAWAMFTVDNGGSAEHTGVGADYFAVCRRSAQNGCADAAEVLASMRAVLAGETVERDLEYPCPSPAVGRWFSLRITRIDWPAVGLLVSHTNITVRKMLEQDLERTASQDPLTRLANRARFDERLAHALTPRAQRPRVADVGLLYLDVDRFKEVNDTYGHAVGDEVLQTVASRLSAVCRPQDTVARLGGDEFAIIAPRVRASGLASLVSRLEETLSAPHRIHGQDVAIGVSVGAHLASPDEDGAASLQRADEAMYLAKRSARAAAGAH